MGLLSSLGLLLTPLVSRSRSIPIDSETKRLKDELEKSRVEIDRLRVDILMWMDIADDWRRRAVAQHNAAQGLQQSWHVCDCSPRHGRYGFLQGEGVSE